MAGILGAGILADSFLPWQTFQFSNPVSRVSQRAESSSPRSCGHDPGISATPAPARLDPVVCGQDHPAPSGCRHRSRSPGTQLQAPGAHRPRRAERSLWLLEMASEEPRS